MDAGLFEDGSGHAAYYSEGDRHETRSSPHSFPSPPLVALPALAAEEPDAVYVKYHRAAVARDLDEMLQYAPAAQRAELSGMSAAQKDAAMKMLEAATCRAPSSSRTRPWRRTASARACW